MKKIKFFYFLSFFIYINAYSQVKDTLLLDNTSLKDFKSFDQINKIYVFDARIPFYVVNKKTFQNFIADSANFQKLIVLFDRRDSIRAKNLLGLNNYYDELLRQYKDLTDKVETNISFNNGKLTQVHDFLKLAQDDVRGAKSDINSSQKEIVKAQVNIESARDEIKEAVKDLKKVKKLNGIAIPIGTAIIGILLGHYVWK